MGLEFETKKLVAYIRLLKSSGEFQIKLKGPPSEGPADEHVGAIIADATLSARHNYEKQVKPVVTKLKSTYPKGSTTSGFLCLIHSIGPEKLLDGWEKDSAEKLRQIQVVETAQFFADHDIETFSDLAAWIKQESNRQELKKEVHGIGNKIADYYGVLTGNPDAVAIDVRISIFLSNAGIDTNNYSYKEKRTIVQLAARQMGYGPLDLEQSIWDYNPKRKQKGEEMDKNNKDSILGVHLPPQKMEQLETIAREEYDEQPQNLAKFWIIERLHQLGVSLKSYSAPQSRDIASGEPQAAIRKGTKTRSKLRREMVRETVNREEFRSRSFSKKQFCKAMEGEYGLINTKSFVLTDWCVNRDGGPLIKDANGRLVTKYPYLFSPKRGIFTRYDPDVHGQ